MKFYLIGAIVIAAALGFAMVVLDSDLPQPASTSADDGLRINP